MHAGEQGGVARRGQVGENHAPGELGGSKRLEWTATKHDFVRKPGGGQRAGALGQRRGVKVERQHRPAREPGPSLGEEPRAAAHVNRRSVRKVDERGQAHPGGGMIAGPKALPGRLYQLAHAGWRGGVGGASSVPA